MGRGHQFRDCLFEALLHAAGSRSDLRNRGESPDGDARFVLHVCGTTEEVFTSIYFLTTISLLQFTFSKIVSLSVIYVAFRFFKRTSSACWEQPPESFKHGPRRAWFWDCPLLPPTICSIYFFPCNPWPYETFCILIFRLKVVWGLKTLEKITCLWFPIGCN